ncbi:MAG: Methyltransferase type 11 [Parcubacteria group bacterium Gr01-1014_18]|nr:MAG: Methyltransferase type 11 [Parcubacteria group bacterium Greene0416_36]TSC80152.1 MAG: Methyltransferase type 11 [Parcubacteria group bacterium Gr01-1014_18]TSC99366.1 MAG: Methyltransferase type 11 [Parcubacteria group bacterium Greene1014_20]TSD06798.1 MAG: Methyltransferase type 11 [Parcubacteria group bacterium Greene0714_2]
MTQWDGIYKSFLSGGSKWATLGEGIIEPFQAFMKSHSFLQKNALDIGCGNGKYLLFLKQLGFQLTGLDNSLTAIKVL